MAADQRGTILGHAARLFQTKGYHAATMDDLAAAVQLNKATVYYYFESKANLLFEIMLSVADQRLAMLRALPSDLSPDEQIRRFVVDNIAFLAERPAEATVSYQEASFIDQSLGRDQVKMIRARQRDARNHAESIIRSGQQQGRFDEELDAQIVAEALTGMLSWFVRWYRPSRKFSAKDVGDQWGQLILRGLLHVDGADDLPLPALAAVDFQTGRDLPA